MSPVRPPLAIIGATATGKSALAMRIAELDPRVEILSADSMQVYRGMDIGTAKPTADEQARVSHHLIDIADPHEDFSLSTYVSAAHEACAEIVGRDRVPVLVGGTGLYVRAVIDRFDIPGQYPTVRTELEAESDTVVLHQRLADLDPVAAARMEPTNRRRVLRALEVTLGSGRPFSEWGPGMEAYPPIDTTQLAVDRPRPSIDERIDRRYERQMESGFLAEVQQLAANPAGLSRTARQALGYKELLDHLEGRATLEDALELARRRTRRFARRQQRWFRRDPRIEWIDLDERDLDAVAATMVERLTGWPDGPVLGNPA